MRVDVKQAETKVLAAPEGPFLVAPEAAILRDELQSMVLRDLLGPAGGPEEELDVDRVHERYLVGLLAPNRLQTMPEEQDELGIADEESQENAASDNGASQVPGLVPSSLGLSFCASADASELRVTASWGQYVKERSETLLTSKGNPKMVWRRKARGGQAELISLREGPLRAWQPEPEEQPDVFVKGIVRRGSEGWTVTLFLVNGQEEPKRNKDTAWLFQPELIVETPDGAALFQRRPPGRQTPLTDEERPMAMLYRRHVGFATGHGVSVHAETPAGDPTCAFRLSTSVVPSYDVARTDAPGVADMPALADLTLDMRTLAENPASELPAQLRPLVTAYALWIAEQAARINDPASGLTDYQDVAEIALQHCRQTMQRIEDGLTLLGTHAEAGRAFAFMNRAMWQQRIHTIHAEEQRRGGTRTLEELDQPGNRSWRPFQLAFILLNLPALTDLNHPSALVPHRRRQDRSLPWSDRLYPGHAQPARSRRRSFGGGWRGRDYALYPAPADAATIPASRFADLRLRDDPPGGKLDLGSNSLSSWPLGRAAFDAQHHRRKRGGQSPGAWSARQRLWWRRQSAPVNQLSLVWFSDRRRQEYRR